MPECISCRELKAASEFTVQRQKSGLLFLECKPCRAATQRVRRARRAEAVERKQSRAYRLRCDARGPAGGLYSTYKNSAKPRGYEFQLTYDEFEAICRRDCTYCGGQPEMRGRRKATVPVNGIDRRDNSVGYTLENCVPCCTRCNHLKGKLSVDEFLESVHSIHEHMSKAAKPAD